MRSLIVIFYSVVVKRLYHHSFIESYKHFHYSYETYVLIDAYVYREGIAPLFLCSRSNKSMMHEFCTQFGIYKSADKSLPRPGRKQATATEDFDFHISY